MGGMDKEGKETELEDKKNCCKRTVSIAMKTGIVVVCFYLLLNSLLWFVVEFSSTQCFTRVVPSIPNHGLQEIPRVKTLTSESLTQHVKTGMPVVVTDQMQDWPAMQKWQDISYFAKACPHFETEGMTMVKFVEAMKAIETYIDTQLTPKEAQQTDFNLYFSHNEELFAACPSLWEDVKNFSLIRDRGSKPNDGMLSFLSRYLISMLETDFLPSEFVWGDWIQAVTWIGPPGSRTKLHYDDDPVSILYQFKGEKLVRIWSPDQSRYLYPEVSCSERYEYGTRFSRIDSIEDHNPKRFPLFQNATELSTILRPGEYIYIPSGWWHHVTVLTTSVSVAARSYSTCEGLSYLPNFLVNYLHDRNIVDGEGFCIMPRYLKSTL